MTQFSKVHASRATLLRADIVVVLLSFALGMGFVRFLGSASSPFLAQVQISSSLSSLPEYAILSLTRSIIALFLSFLFAIFYGTLAAKSKTLGRILIPLLDVLQCLPVVAFLPGLVLALISIFHSSRWGLELACILTIFTGQVWNLAFAYYESQRTLQPEFVEVAIISRLSSVKRFFLVDLPNGYRPLIYNGMMSMAGGWFFLTTCEDFPLGNQNFKLPGLGSYLAETFNHGQYLNFSLGLLVLLFIVIGTDFLLWKPMIAWVSKYRDGDDEKKQNPEDNWFLNVIKDANIFGWISIGFKKILHLLFPQQNFQEKGRTRIVIIDSIEVFTLFIDKLFLHISRYILKLKGSSWLSALFTFAVGGLVFSLLPKIPEFGKTLSLLTNADWFHLVHSVIKTTMKIFLVIFFSTLWTLPAGLYIGLNNKFEKICQPIIQNLAAFPAPVLFPLLTFLLAKTFLSSFFITVFLMCVGSQWYILFNVIGGASRVPAELKLVTRIYKFSPWHKFTRLYFPAILPSLTTGWITAAGGAWNASMVAELVSYPGGILHSDGIGAELSQASGNGNYTLLVAAIICIVVALVIINRTVWRKIYEYSEHVKD